MKKQTLLRACCALIIFLFLYASVSKLAHFRLFLHDMYNQPFPYWFASFLIGFIPLSEIVISALLIFDRTRRAGLWGSLGLMSLFTVYTGAVLLNFFGKAYPCSCGGVIRKLTWNQHLILNLAFIGIALTGIGVVKKLRRQSPINRIAYT